MRHWLRNSLEKAFLFKCNLGFYGHVDPWKSPPSTPASRLIFRGTVTTFHYGLRKFQLPAGKNCFQIRSCTGLSTSLLLLGEKGNQSSPRLLNSAVVCVKGLQLSCCQPQAQLSEYQLLPKKTLGGCRNNLEPSSLISCTNTALGSLQRVQPKSWWSFPR